MKNILEMKHLDPGYSESSSENGKVILENISDWEKKEPHERIGVLKNATKEEIIKAHRILTVKYHPDKIINDDAKWDNYSQVQKLLNDSRDVLFKKLSSSGSKTEYKYEKAHDPKPEPEKKKNPSDVIRDFVTLAQFHLNPPNRFNTGASLLYKEMEKAEKQGVDRIVLQKEIVEIVKKRLSESTGDEFSLSLDTLKAYDSTAVMMDWAEKLTGMKPEDVISIVSKPVLENLDKKVRVATSGSLTDKGLDEVAIFFGKASQLLGVSVEQLAARYETKILNSFRTTAKVMELSNNIRSAVPQIRKIMEKLEKIGISEKSLLSVLSLMETSDGEMFSKYF
jgi:hypothetical protein